MSRTPQIKRATPPPSLRVDVLYCDDNLHQLAHFPSGCVDLVYLDPPFFSNRQYEVIWGDEAEIRSFEDRWEGGVEVYVGWMKERVQEMYRVLQPTGTFYLHCDWHASHYLKVMCDQIFGMHNFRNEIVWCYSGGGVPRQDFPRKHDTILRYTKSDRYTFNPIYRPYTAGTMQRGRTAIKGIYAKRGLRKEGTPVNDWWTDVPKITSPTDYEKLGYPTQKPEALLKRIITASSNEGDLVLDPFCGCGTTMAVAQQLRRHWIGIDISPKAIELVKRRLQKLGVGDIDTINMPTTIDALKQMKPFEFQNWVVLDRFHGTMTRTHVGDKGIDGYAFMTHEPIQVKQSERVGRNIVDNFQTAMEREKKQKGYIVAFSFGRGAHEEAARCKRAKGLEIVLVTVEDLLRKPA